MDSLCFSGRCESPSPDDLYLRAISGDTAAIQAFLQLYPEDSRLTEVEDLQFGVRLRGILKRLNAQSKLGITDLTPDEESFLKVMQDRELNPTQAAGRIEQWLNVYDSGAQVAQDELSELIALAKHEQQRLLERAPLNVIDTRAEKLLNRIRQVMETDDPSRVRKELKGIVDTFGEIDWAKPAVDEAAKQLSEFEARVELLENINTDASADANSKSRNRWEVKMRSRHQRNLIASDGFVLAVEALCKTCCSPVGSVSGVRRL